MRDRRPPRLAIWLLKRPGASRENEALLGDLVEEFHRGRTAGWFWRQTLTAILAARGKTRRSNVLALLVERGVMASIVVGFLWIHGPLHVGWDPLVLLMAFLSGLAALTHACGRTGDWRRILVDLAWTIAMAWIVVVGLSFISPFLDLTISPLGTLFGFVLTLPGDLWRAIRRRPSNVRPG